MTIYEQLSSAAFRQIIVKQGQHRAQVRDRKGVTLNVESCFFASAFGSLDGKIYEFCRDSAYNGSADVTWECNSSNDHLAA
jgi:hypothetical protein